jgi:hypothetical protein
MSSPLRSERYTSGLVRLIDSSGAHPLSRFERCDFTVSFHTGDLIRVDVHSVVSLKTMEHSRGHVLLEFVAMHRTVFVGNPWSFERGLRRGESFELRP